MKAVARRKLTVLDAMILVAAAAAGFAAARAYYLAARDSSSVSQLKMLIFSKQMLAISMAAAQESRSRMGSLGMPSASAMQSGPPSVAAIEQEIAACERRIALEKFFSSNQVFLTSWTFALVWLGVQKPRPRLRRLVLEAGWAACLTVIVVLVVRTLSVVVSWGTALPGSTRISYPRFVAVFDDLGHYIGPAIVAVWVIIAMSGRGRLEWSSIGWLTTLTAIIWVLLIFGEAAIKLLAPL